MASSLCCGLVSAATHRVEARQMGAATLCHWKFTLSTRDLERSQLSSCFQTLETDFPPDSAEHL